MLYVAVNGSHPVTCRRFDGITGGSYNYDMLPLLRFGGSALMKRVVKEAQHALFVALHGPCMPWYAFDLVIGDGDCKDNYSLSVLRSG